MMVPTSAPSCSLMNNLNSDLLIHIISYLNIIDSSKLSEADKRLYFLTIQFRNLSNAQIATCSSSIAWEKRRLPQDNYHQCLSNLTVAPTFGLCFTSGGVGSDLPHYIHQQQQQQQQRKNNNNMLLLGAHANAIQSNCETRVEHEIDATLMMGYFPSCQTVPFVSNRNYGAQQVVNELLKVQQSNNNSHDYWKMVLVYACGNILYEDGDFIATLQQLLPNTTIVGGICEEGHVSRKYTPEEMNKMKMPALRKLLALYTNDDDIANAMSQSELLQECLLHTNEYVVDPISTGYFGMAFGGDVPVRSIVSRGVKSVLGNSGEQQQSQSWSSASRWSVHDVELVDPNDDAYMFQSADPDSLKPVHVIKSIRDAQTLNCYPPVSLLRNESNRHPEFIGLRRPGTDGFELNSLNPFSIQGNGIIVMTDGSEEQTTTLLNADIDLFVIDADACNTDMDYTLQKLKEQTKDEVILGGVMYSCSWRGPEKSQSALKEEMADAVRFHSHFPNVSLVGFYADGEFGPRIVVGKQNIFQQGKAEVQGYTAVFLLFIVPAPSVKSFNLDDDAQQVNAFIKARFGLL